MPPTTQSFIKRLARLAPQLGSSGSPSRQIADQASGGGFLPGASGPTTTVPWGGGGGFNPPVAGPPAPRTAPTLPIFGPASIAQSAGSPSGPNTPAQTTGNFAPSSTLTPPDRTPPTGAMPELSGSGTIPASVAKYHGITGAFANFDPLTHELAKSEPSSKPALNPSNGAPYQPALPASAPETLSSIPAVHRAAYTLSDGTFDSSSYLAAQKDRVATLAKFYNLNDDQLKVIMSEVDNQAAAAASDSKVNQTQATEAALLNVQKALITGKGTITGVTDRTSTGAGGTGGGTPMSGSQIVSAATQSPFAQYGVYTPDQQIAMQAMIGNYVQSQDQRFAAGGGHLDPKISAAYMEQAQAMPAIKAFEGQAQLAKQNQDLQAQYDNLKMQYQLQQWMQSQANQSGGATSSADFSNMVNSLGVSGAGS